MSEFYDDLRLSFSVIMSADYSFKSDADLIRRISLHYNINYPQLPNYL